MNMHVKHFNYFGIQNNDYTDYHAIQISYKLRTVFKL